MDTFDAVQAKMIGVISVRVPSEAIFKSALEVETSFGVPISASNGGLTMDVDRCLSVVKAFDGDNNKKLQFLTISGMTSSALEHRVPEQLFATPANAVEGVSAVKALQLASSQGIPVYKVTKDNITSVLPQLQLDSSVIDDIRNAVGAGNEVTVSKTNITFNGWTGCGYIVLNPTTGSGAYMLSGGQSGAAILQIGAGIMWALFSVPLLIFPPAGIISILGGVAVILDGIKQLVDSVVGFYKDVTWDFYYNDYNGFDWCVLIEVGLLIFAIDALCTATLAMTATQLQIGAGGFLSAIASTGMALITFGEPYCIIGRTER